MGSLSNILHLHIYEYTDYSYAFAPKTLEESATDRKRRPIQGVIRRNAA